MYFRRIETDKDAMVAHNNDLKVNAKERRAAQAAYKKKQKLDAGKRLA